MVVAVYRSRISIATLYYYFYFLIKESNILGRHSKYEYKTLVRLQFGRFSTF